jgi:hypothetical protein
VNVETGKKRFDILTPACNIIVHGTRFMLKVTPTKTFIETFDGLVEAVNSSGNVFVHAGEATFVTTTLAPAKPARILAGDSITSPKITIGLDRDKFSMGDSIIMGVTITSDKKVKILPPMGSAQYLVLSVSSDEVHPFQVRLTPRTTNLDIKTIELGDGKAFSTSCDIGNFFFTQGTYLIKVIYFSEPPDDSRPDSVWGGLIESEPIKIVIERKHK